MSARASGHDPETVVKVAMKVTQKRGDGNLVPLRSAEPAAPARYPAAMNRGQTADGDGVKEPK